MKRAGGYVRVSQVGQRDQDKWLTGPTQVKAIEGWTRGHQHGLSILHEDYDRSGGDSDRENLLDLVSRIESGELDTIVVARLDRFGRSLLHGLLLLERIKESGGRFIAVENGLDTETPEGDMQLKMLLMLADYELQRYKRFWRSTRETLVLERGFHWGANPPFGYLRLEKGGRLVVDPDTGPIATEIFKRMAAGEGPSEVAAWVREQGVLTNRGGLPSGTWIRSMVKNRAYLGEASSGDIVLEGAHPALVDQVTFDRANTVKGPRPTRREDDPALLAGILRCQACRHALYVDRLKSIEVYRCPGQHSGGPCPDRARVERDLIEDAVTEAFFAEVGNAQARASSDTGAIERLTVARDQARHEMTTFRDEPGIIAQLGARDYAEGLRVRQAYLNEAEDALRLEVAKRPNGLPDASSLRADWPDIDVPRRRRMLKAQFDAIVVARGHDSRSPLAGRCWAVPVGTFEKGVLPRAGGGKAGAPKPFDRPSRAWVALG